MMLAVESIRVIDRLREANAASIAALAESIAEIGLQTPITVARIADFVDGQEVTAWKLVAGLHRLEAHKSLGLVEIEAREIEDDEVIQKLWECDENLCRSELTPSQRARFTAERKTYYEIRHPETRHGGAPGKAGGGKATKDDKLASFASDTARASGRSERDVQRDARRGAKVSDTALKVIEGTAADTGKNLDALARLDPAEQARAAKRLLEGKPIAAPSRAIDDYEAINKQIAKLVSAWNAAGPEARRIFLDEYCEGRIAA